MSYHVYYRGKLSITPPLTEADAAIVVAFLRGEKNEIFDRAVQAGEDTSALWTTEMLVLCDGRDTLFPVEDESRPGLDVWLRLLQDYFMAAMGYALNGRILWEAEEPSDLGVIYVKDGAIESVVDEVHNPGPSWGRVHYASPGVVKAVRALAESADNTGCTPDLTVVASEPLDSLKAMLSQQVPG